ncbi:hypothetical protein ACN20G_28160 (plasmid) [Streptomyces sp. BI20]|uniref:hypothetical protein n=1 Tax=Streptomyces sp. BI20 TaxID=3403460 RepID=UPI003C72AE41
MSDPLGPLPVGRRTAADVAARIRRPRKSVPLVLDGEVADAIEQAERQLAYAIELDEESNEPDQAPALRERLRALHEQAEESRQTFVFQGIPSRRYRVLVGQNPPTDAQLDDARRKAAFLGVDPVMPEVDQDGLAAALCAAMAVEPAGTPEEWAALWDELSDGQIAVLYSTALAAQLGVVEVGPKPASA